MSALMTRMEEPLGEAVGHANETIEAFDALRPGNREKAPADLVVLTEELVADMVRVSGAAPAREAALAAVRDACIESAGKYFKLALQYAS